MPKRKSDAVRSATGSVMVAVVIFSYFFVYYVFVVLNWIPRLENDDYWILTVIILSLYHILAFMLGWSFVQTLITDPGEVPIYWGFRVGDPDDRRRRYWLMWNLYKPERWHHWSTCGRWILNMDHHCPWVNNWIGFWNRKYFMLLLFYVQISTVFILVTLAYDMFKSIVWVGESIVNLKAPHLHELQVALFTIIAYLFSSLICLLMSFFFKFHRKLARENKTTIENLENKNKEYISKYDINETDNVEQIMGTVKWLWPFPIMPSFAKPKGDGINFEKKFDTDEDEEEGEGEGNDNRIVDNDDQRDPVHFRGNDDQNLGQGTQGNSQTNLFRPNNVSSQVCRPGTELRPNDQNNSIADATTKQGSKMTVYNDSGNNMKNLNNIVHSENTYDDNKSNDNLKLASPSSNNSGQLGNKQAPRRIQDDKTKQVTSEYLQEGSKKTAGSKQQRVNRIF